MLRPGGHMNDAAAWVPCPQCRNPVFVVRDHHWMEFRTAAELERHLKDNLAKSDVESGYVASIVRQWKMRERTRSMEREACRDPMRSLEKMFEQQFGRR